MQNQPGICCHRIDSFVCSIPLVFIVRFVLSSEYLFELLKTDLQFVQSDKMLKLVHLAHREKVLEGIRIALELMFVYDPKTDSTMLKKMFDDLLLLYERQQREKI